MILEFSDWVFLVNAEETRAYSDEESANHCTCGYCRNFYQTVDKTYPDLRYFLSRFGLNIDAPESLIPLTPTLYQASFVVQGRILRPGSEPIFVNDIAVTIEDDPDPECFILNVGMMNLPWVLKEDVRSIQAPMGISDLFSSYKQ